MLVSGSPSCPPLTSTATPLCSSPRSHPNQVSLPFCGGETGLVLLTYAERSFSATQRAAVGTGYGLSETLHLLVYQIDRQLIINGIFKQIWILI